MKKIGYALTSSLCTIRQSLEQLKILIEKGYDITPIVSPQVVTEDTQYGNGHLFKEEIEDMTKKAVIVTIKGIEPLGPSKALDALVIAPVTGNTIAKITAGITDTPVTMAVKSTLRNQRPIVLCIATNDGLGANGKNIADLLNRKYFYFVPYGQDNPEKKPTSLISHFELLPETLSEALNGRQLQPVIYQKCKNCNHKKIDK